MYAPIVTVERGSRSLHDALHVGAGGPDVNAAWRVTVAAGLAHRIRALHDARIVHRDVQASNALVSNLVNVVLADAGAGVARRMKFDAQGTGVWVEDGYRAGAYPRSHFSSA
jgi:tRNA A-37 threonylcarbamoyl transferase component Bud32